MKPFVPLAPRPISAFEARSKLLFASLVLSGAASAQSVLPTTQRGVAAPVQQTQTPSPAQPPAPLRTQ